MPTSVANVSSDTFDEIVNAFADKGVKLQPGGEFLIKKDMAIKGPINYRQVNLRHEILKEIIHVYKTPLVNDIETNDASNFVEFWDAAYKYALTGEKPEITKEVIEEAKTPTAKSGW